MASGSVGGKEMRVSLTDVRVELADVADQAREVMKTGSWGVSTSFP